MQIGKGSGGTIGRTSCKRCGPGSRKSNPCRRIQQREGCLFVPSPNGKPEKTSKPDKRLTNDVERMRRMWSRSSQRQNCFSVFVKKQKRGLSCENGSDRG